MTDTQHSSRIRRILPVFLLAGVLGAGSAYAYTHTAVWYTPATQMVIPNSGTPCTFGSRSTGSHTYRYAACSQNDVLGFATSGAPVGFNTADMNGVTEGIGNTSEPANGIQVWFASEGTDTTNPVCFQAYGSVQEWGSNWDNAWGTPAEIWVGAAIPTGQWDTAVATILPINTTPATRYYYLNQAGSVNCGTDVCGWDETIYYAVIRQHPNTCCTATSTPWACCSGAQTGSCTDNGSDADVLGIRVTMVAPVE